MDRLELSLEQNTLSFIEDALSNAIVAEEAPHQWKFAILSMVQAIELSLKQALKLQHPILIYENVDRPKRTVTLSTAISRLERVVDGFSPTPDERAAIQLATEVRHTIVHYEVAADVRQLKLAFARLLGFLSEFQTKHLGRALRNVVEDELWQKGAAIQEHGKELFKGAKARMLADDVDEFARNCPNCGWPALPVLDDDFRCYVCGVLTDPRTICSDCGCSIDADAGCFGRCGDCYVGYAFG